MRNRWTPKSWTRTGPDAPRQTLPIRAVLLVCSGRQMQVTVARNPRHVAVRNPHPGDARSPDQTNRTDLRMNRRNHFDVDRKRAPCVGSPAGAARVGAARAGAGSEVPPARQGQAESRAPEAFQPPGWIRRHEPGRDRRTDHRRMHHWRRASRSAPCSVSVPASLPSPVRAAEVRGSGVRAAEVPVVQVRPDGRRGSVPNRSPASGRRPRPDRPPARGLQSGQHATARGLPPSPRRASRRRSGRVQAS